MEKRPFGPTSRAWLTSRLACDEITPATYQSYSAHLKLFAAHVGDDRPTTDITAADLETWLAMMRVQSSTKQTRMATLRAFFGWASEPGPDQLIPFDPTRRVRRPRLHRRPLRLVSLDDLQRVLAIADPRDRVLMVVGVQCALRRSELAGLQIEDWDRASQRIYVRGKGRKDRWVPVPEEATAELQAWVAVLGRRSGAIFPSSHRPGESIAPGTVTHIMSKAGRQCDVKLKTHDLRHRGLSDAAANGATSWELKEVAGHSYSSTTDIYIHTSGTAQARAMEGRRYRRRR